MIESKLDPSLPPNFCELDEYRFQRMCADLLQRESGISSAVVYGKRGQMQRGVDVNATRKDGGGIEVGQCKRYTEITANEISVASDDFFEHLEFWRPKAVKRFVLFTACELTDVKLQDQVLKEPARFAAEGIVFEAWGG
jgi:hypothetical protein